jgi:hypothetical protein
LQNELWQLAIQAGRQNPNVVPTGMFITTLNYLIDTSGERDEAQTNQVPESVLALLFLMAILAKGLEVTVRASLAQPLPALSRLPGQ